MTPTIPTYEAIKRRLEVRVATLRAIDTKRQAESDPDIMRSLELRIIRTELADIAEVSES